MFVQKEFSHTVLHGDDILRQQAQGIPSNASHHPASRVPVLTPIVENETPVVRQLPRPPVLSAADNDQAKKRAEEQMERIRQLREAHQQDLLKAKEAENRQKELVERSRRDSEALKRGQEEQRKERPPRNSRESAISVPSNRRDEVSFRKIAIAPKPAVPSAQRISPKPRAVVNPSLQIQGRPITKPKNLPPPSREKNLPPPPPPPPAANNMPPPRPQNLPLGGNPRPQLKSDAQERRRRYEDLKGRNDSGDNAPNVPSPPPGDDSSQSSDSLVSHAEGKQNVNWLKGLELQMDALKNQINDLQSPSVPKDSRTPQKANKLTPAPVGSDLSSSKHPRPRGVPSRRESGAETRKKTVTTTTPPPESEDSLASRKMKREQESRNFREFLKAQRQAKVGHTRVTRIHFIILGG
jgi:hypothetical protein